MSKDQDEDKLSIINKIIKVNQEIEDEFRQIPQSEKPRKNLKAKSNISFDIDRPSAHSMVGEPKRIVMQDGVYD